MKKLISFAIMGLMLVTLVFALAACADAPAALAPSDEDSPLLETEYDDILLVPETIGEPEDELVYGGEELHQMGDWFEMEDTQIFDSVTGQVVSIDDAGDGDLRIQIEGEDGSTVFMTHFNTYFMGSAPEVGTTITGYYVIEPFMMAIYPPQHNATVIVNNDDVQDDGLPFIHVCFFFGHYRDGFGDFAQLRSADGQLVINVGDENTEVILQNGEPFDGDFTNRTLLVTYTMATFSIPPQTTPHKIVVLYERPVTGPEFVELPDDWDFEEVDPWYCVVIDGVGLVGPHALFMDENMDHQTHVELIPVAEFFGAEVEWNQATGEVTLEGLNGSISFIVGSHDFTVNGEVITLYHGSEDFYGMLVVPVLFFSDVFGMASSYSFEGRIYIDSVDVGMR